MSGTLAHYKEEVESTMEARLEWQRELIFTASTQRGYDIDFDAQSQWGCMPLESLLLSLAGCMAIDVVSILEKMRCEITGMRMDIRAERSSTPPQRLESARLMIHLRGNGLDDSKVARAIALSEEKYCSVKHSLREDIEIATEARIEESS
ncbi:OsmC family protein [Myxococcota bacterium]